MENQRASENLEVIRTLMERASIYRRALAPIMTVAGVVGVLGATLPCFIEIQTNSTFSGYWMLVSLVGFVAALLLVRRQALKDEEPFWSPPTRRVTEAVAPPFFVGLILGLVFFLMGDHFPPLTWVLSLGWILFYGCALHAAGFFMVRGIKLFGWIYLLVGCALLFAGVLNEGLRTPEAAHYMMGGLFGALQLIYGIYLYFTENREKEA